MTSLSVERLSGYRGRSKAVSNVTLTIQGPCWFGLVGPNGSGKTTLLRILAGRSAPSEGAIAVDGIDRTADRAWRAAHFGFTPWEDALPGPLTGREMIDILDGENRSFWTDDRLRGLRTSLELEDVARYRIANCSSGMRQRVALACAFAGGSRTVLLDEPFNWLDPVVAADLQAALLALVGQGYTLITAMHELRSMLTLCDFGAVFQSGSVAMLLTRDQMVEDTDSLEQDILARLRLARSTPNPPRS